MNPRDELLDEYGRADTAPLGTLTELRQKLDAYRAQVLNEAADALEARVADVDVPDTSVTWAGMDAAYLRHLAASPAAVPVPDETAGDKTSQIPSLLAAKSDLLDHLERNTLPELRRTIEHHKDGKQRWRDRAEKAEARVAELERPSVEARRNEIRSTYTALISQAEQDRDHEGAATLAQQLRDSEAKWAAEDEAEVAR